MQLSDTNINRPWYKQFWPWFLLFIPAATIVAGITTVVVAVQHDDALVVDDYYKEGLGINRVIEAQQNAARMGLQAMAEYDRNSGVLVLKIDNTGNEILLSLIHPTRKNLDRHFNLQRNSHGHYAVNFTDIEPGRWNMILTDKDKSWRLDANVVLPIDKWVFKPRV